MKRLASLIVALLISVLTFSQEHMKFMGIPMDCTVKQFMAKLMVEGFKYVETDEDGLITMAGSFAGDDVLLWLFDNTDGMISGVCVVMDYNDLGWGTISDDLDFYKDNLTKKYGRPSEVNIKYKYPHKKGSGYELLGFKLGKNMYNVRWDTKEGTVGMTFASTTNTLLFITYVDAINENIDVKREISDL